MVLWNFFKLYICHSEARSFQDIFLHVQDAVISSFFEIQSLLFLELCLYHREMASCKTS